MIESFYFLILTIYSSYWTRFCPFSSSAFYILEVYSKNILKTLTANFMNNFHVEMHVSHTKPWSRIPGVECKVCLSHGAFKVITPTFTGRN